MEVIGLSWKIDKIKRNNSKLLPKSIRGIIVGRSGCGKTTLLLNLLLRPGWLDYNNLQVFGKSLLQTEYKIMRSAFDKKLFLNCLEVILKLFELQKEIEKSDTNVESLIEDIAKSYEMESDTECHFFETADDVPDPAELDMNKNNLMIFDNLQETNQNKCEGYYIRGKHSNVDCFYLAQNYFKLPRQTIQENTNFICLFPQDDRNVDNIYRDHVSRDMKREEFKKFCEYIWSQPHGFAVIDLSSKKDSGKYRSGFDNFYFPNPL